MLQVITNQNNNSYIKKYNSDTHNFIFNSTNGETITWGATIAEDPNYFPFPIIADIEITTICNGVNGTPCKFCYKSNTSIGKNMSLDTAKQIIDKLPKELTQIAFGADAKLEANSDWYEIFKYARSKQIIPNVTVANISDDVADKLASICGAVAVSRYDDKNYCYNSVQKLTDRGMDQVNIHMILSEETYDKALETIKDIKTDSRLNKLNSIVFLSLKQKGRGISYTKLSNDKFKNIINLCLENNISFGFDSCAGNKFLDIIKNTKLNYLSNYCTPCESTRESAYINVNGDFFPCSFTEGTEEWKEGISVLKAKSFDDIWYHPKTVKFRNTLLNNNCNCPLFNV